MKEHLSILQKCPLFTGVDPKDIPIMMTCLGGTIRSFSKKETIIAEGDPAETVGILLSGRAQIVRIDYFGTTMEGAVIATGVDINYFDTLSLSNAISCLAGGRSLSFAFYNFIVIASKPVDTLNDKGIAFFSFRMSF